MAVILPDRIPWQGWTGNSNQKLFNMYRYLSLSIYRSIYQPTYLPTYLSIYLSTYLPIYLPTYLSTFVGKTCCSIYLYQPQRFFTAVYAPGMRAILAWKSRENAVTAVPPHSPGVDLHTFTFVTFNVIVYVFYHGESPCFTTIWGICEKLFLQPPNKQI